KTSAALDCIHSTNEYHRHHTPPDYFTGDMAGHSQWLLRGRRQTDFLARESGAYFPVVSSHFGAVRGWPHHQCVGRPIVVLTYLVGHWLHIVVPIQPYVGCHSGKSPPASLNQVLRRCPGLSHRCIVCSHYRGAIA